MFVISIKKNISKKVYFETSYFHFGTSFENAFSIILRNIKNLYHIIISNFHGEI